ncbi:hypothetical protein FO519_010797, partial [Halicephalobus sp. NKZ332]
NRSDLEFNKSNRDPLSNSPSNNRSDLELNKFNKDLLSNSPFSSQFNNLFNNRLDRKLNKFNKINSNDGVNLPSKLLNNLLNSLPSNLLNNSDGVSLFNSNKFRNLHPLRFNRSLLSNPFNNN